MLKDFSLKSFLFGLIFIFISVILFIFPKSSLINAIYLFTLSTLLLGIYKLIQTYIEYNKEKELNKVSFVTGFVSIVLSLIIVLMLLLNQELLLTILPWILAIFLLYEAGSSIYTEYKEKTINKQNLVFYIINIIVAIILVIFPTLSNDVTVYLIAIYLLSTGVLYIRK